MNKLRKFILNMGYKTGFYDYPVDENSKEFKEMVEKSVESMVLDERFKDATKNILTYLRSPIVYRIEKTVTNGLGYLDRDSSYIKRNNLDEVLSEGFYTLNSADLRTHLFLLELIAMKDVIADNSLNHKNAQHEMYFHRITDSFGQIQKNFELSIQKLKDINNEMEKYLKKQ